MNLGGKVFEVSGSSSRFVKPLRDNHSNPENCLAILRINMDQSFKTESDSATLEQLKDLIAEVCMVDRKSINGNSRLLGFGINSIRAIELMVSIEEAFKIQLEVEDLTGISTVRELADLIDLKHSR